MPYHIPYRHYTRVRHTITLLCVIKLLPHKNDLGGGGLLLDIGRVLKRSHSSTEHAWYTKPRSSTNNTSIAREQEGLIYCMKASYLKTRKTTHSLLTNFRSEFLENGESAKRQANAPTVKKISTISPPCRGNRCSKPSPRGCTMSRFVRGSLVRYAATVVYQVPVGWNVSGTRYQVCTKYACVYVGARWYDTPVC